MKRSKVTVPWEEGLHLRPAATLVKTAQRFKSVITLKYDDSIADLRSIISVIALCATAGSVLELEASGEDEEIAARAVAEMFVSEELDS
ncbi:HPr family phosphocarrier protein [Verrucomicrobiales bacterium BCK34]|nr:HPr family phosphocarrier protein [Verrucomicrobiales bacterium BCK34]